MAVLKIPGYDSVATWITNVARVDRVRIFNVKKGSNPWDCCWEEEAAPDENVLQVEFPSHDQVGMLLRVFIQAEEGMAPRPQLWIVPFHTCYLMEGGKTIDRL